MAAKKPKPDLVPCWECGQTGEVPMASSAGDAFDFGSGRLRQAALLSKIPQSCPGCLGFGWRIMSVEHPQSQELPALSGKPSTLGK